MILHHLSRIAGAGGCDEARPAGSRGQPPPVDLFRRLVPYVVKKPARVPGVWRGRVTIQPHFDELSATEQAEWFGE
jgi:hypothetical protein